MPLRQKKKSRLRKKSHPRKAKRSLSMDDAFFRQVVETACDGICIVDAKARIAFVNRHLAAMLGYKPAEMVGRHLFDLVGKANRPEAKRLWQRQKKQPIELFEFRLRCKGGGEVWAVVRPNSFYDARGRFAGVMAVISDVTDRRRAEGALRISEREKAVVLASINELIVYQDTRMRILWANRAAGDSVAQKPEQLIGRYCYEIWHGRRTPCKECPVRKVFRNARPHEGEVTSPDGRSWRIRGYPVRGEGGKVVGAVEVTEDITDRHRTERALEESKRVLQTLLANLPGTAYRCANDADWTVEFVSDGFRTLTGYDPADVVGNARLSYGRDVIHPDDQQQVWDEVQAALARREPFRFVYRIRAADGREKWIWEQGRGVFAPDGRLTHLEGFITNITERVQAEHALRESERKYRDLFEDSRDVVYRTSLDGRVLDVNPAGLELFGYTRKEMIGMSVERIYADPADRAAFLCAMESKSAVRNYEVRFRRKDGTVLDCVVTATVWRDPEGRAGGFHGTIRDVTEQKRAEVRFQAYHRQLRVLASELALAEERERRRMAEGLHDHVAQGLTVAKLKLDTLCEAGPEGDLARRLDEIRGAIEETIHRTRSLIFDFSPPVLHELGFEAALEWLVEDFQARNGLPATFQDDGCPKPLQEPVRLTLFRATRELLANVVRHAKARNIAVRVQRDGGEIRVGVEDDGAGFDPAILNDHRTDSMAFGLFSIRERLDYYGGRLEIVSQPGKGTRVTLRAPLAPQDAD